MSKFKDWYYSSYFGKALNAWKNNFDFKSVVNKLTGSGLTGAEREANLFNASEAQKQRDWETNMSNTTYQRAVADMKAAGLNPAMLYGGASSASVSGGASASSVSPSSGVGELLSFMSSLFGTMIKKDIADKDRDTRRELTLEQLRLQNVDINNRFQLYQSQIGLNNASSRNLDVKTSYIPKEFGLKELMNKSQVEVNSSLINLQSSQIARNYSESEFSSVQAALGSLDYKYRESYLRSMIELNNSMSRLNSGKLYQIKRSVEQRDQELSLLEWARRQGDTQLTIEARKVEKQIDLMESQRVINGEQAKFLKSQRGWFIANQLLDNLIYKPVGAATDIFGTAAGHAKAKSLYGNFYPF